MSTNDDTFILDGSIGNDYLYASNAEDSSTSNNALANYEVVQCGTGNDLVEGYPDNTAFIYNKGDGNDVIEYQKLGYTSNPVHYDDCDYVDYNFPIHNLVIFNMDRQDVVFSRNSTDLIIGIKDTNEQVDIRNCFSSQTYENAISFKFDDQELSTKDVLKLLYAPTNNDDYLLGDDSNNSIYGYNGNDTLFGGGGDDVLVGGNGDDYLDGGSGDDYLNGGWGSDVYKFSKGSGNDFIIGNISRQNDSIEIGMGILPEDIEYSYRNGNLVLTLKDLFGDGADSLTITDWCLDSSHQIGSIHFTDGTVINAEQINQMNIGGNNNMVFNTSNLNNGSSY